MTIDWFQIGIYFHHIIRQRNVVIMTEKNLFATDLNWQKNAGIYFVITAYFAIVVRAADGMRVCALSASFISIVITIRINFQLTSCL